MGVVQSFHILVPCSTIWNNPGTVITTGTTLSQKVWDQHLVHRAEGEADLLYVGLHLVHEVTSPQEFAGLRLWAGTGRGPGARPASTFARCRPASALAHSAASSSTRRVTSARASST